MGLPGIYLDGSLFSPYESDADAERALFRVLEALVGANVAYLHAYPKTPRFYDAPIQYVRDPLGVEWWKGIERILETGTADCKSLAAWRVAELRCLYGEDGSSEKGLARFRLTKHPKGNGVIIYHVTIYRGDDSLEDPSAILGMGAVH